MLDMPLWELRAQLAIVQSKAVLPYRFRSDSMLILFVLGVTRHKLNRTVVRSLRAAHAIHSVVLLELRNGQPLFALVSVMLSTTLRRICDALTVTEFELECRRGGR